MAVPVKAWAGDAKTTARFFGVALDDVERWTREGCPVVNSGPRGGPTAYYFPEVHRWHMRHADERVLSKADYNTRKIVADANYKEAQAARIRGELMPRDEHLAVMRDWAAAFKFFWAESVKKNWHLFIDQPADAVRVLFDEFGRQLMDKWIGEK